MPQAPSNLTLRPALPEDLNWLNGFYEEIMRPYVELTHAWDPARFRELYDPARSWIIGFDGREIGFLSWEVRLNYVYFNNIQIHPDYRGRGLGTRLIQHVIAEAEQLRLPIRLRVLKGNPAKDLYLRLGFREDAELEHSWELLHDGGARKEVGFNATTC